MRNHLLPLLLCLGCLLGSLTSCGGTAGSAHPDEKDIQTFLTHYFATWSAKDMDGYGGCFHPTARISFVQDGKVSSQGLTDFLHGQRLGHERTPIPMTEVPTSMKIHGDPRVAQAEVRWKLTKGPETVTGTDYFTLVKTREGWKIGALVFYND